MKQKGKEIYLKGFQENGKCKELWKFIKSRKGI